MYTTYQVFIFLSEASINAASINEIPNPCSLPKTLEHSRLLNRTMDITFQIKSTNHSPRTHDSYKHRRKNWVAGPLWIDLWTTQPRLFMNRSDCLGRPTTSLYPQKKHSTSLHFSGPVPPSASTSLSSPTSPPPPLLHLSQP